MPTREIEIYLRSLSPERASIMRTVRETVLANLPDGYVERFAGGMINYEIPLSRYPKTYNHQPLLLAGLASQKSFVTLYLMAVYGDKNLASWFEAAYAESGKKLDMGKSCVHFKTAADIPVKVIGQAIAKVPIERYVEIYESARLRPKRK